MTSWFLYKIVSIIVIILSLITNIFTQNKSDYYWLFGITDNEPSIHSMQSYIFDFNEKPFKPKISDIGIGIENNNASICTKDGKFLFYSNGCAVLNADRNLMPNGDSINPRILF